VGKPLNVKLLNLCGMVCNTIPPPGFFYSGDLPLSEELLGCSDWCCVVNCHIILCYKLCCASGAMRICPCSVCPTV